MLHTAAKLPTSVAVHLGIIMVAASISTFAAPGATAQTGAGGNNRVTAGKGQQPVTDKVIISHTPKFKSKAYSVLSRVLGKKEFETTDESRNLALIAIPTLGEAYHNSHHAFPTSATHGLRWWQLDVSSLVINGLEKAGLVWDVVRVSPERQAAKAAG